MNIGTAGGKIFLLYQHAEEKNVRKMRKQLTEQGIIAVPCEDPANFRFVTPEVIQTSPETMELIGRTALKYLGTYSANDNFVKDIKEQFAKKPEVAA